MTGFAGYVLTRSTVMMDLNCTRYNKYSKCLVVLEGVERNRFAETSRHLHFTIITVPLSAGSGGLPFAFSALHPHDEITEPRSTGF